MAKKASSRQKKSEFVEDDDSLDSALQKAWHRKLENMIVNELPNAIREIGSIKDRIDLLEDISKINGCEKLNGHLKMHRFAYWLITIVAPIIISLLMMLFGKKLGIGF